jgi:hypothetical protein
MLVAQQGSPSNSVVGQSSPVASVPSISTTSLTQVPTPQSIADSSSADLQTQMMLLLSESFTKLSTTLGEQKQDTKADWHKFSGDCKKFRGWYLGIMAHISLPPWKDLYDPVRNDVVTSTSNALLNGKLYSKILLSLDGMAYQNFVLCKHLRADGIRLLQEWVQTYKPKNVSEVIVAKTVEFWGNTKRLATESVDSYYDCFQELLEDLVEADEPISTKAAMGHFIFTLGSDFYTIQNNFRINNLPVEWQTQDWPSVLNLCCDNHNSVKSTPSFKRPGKDSGKDPKDASFDREAHQKKVREWFLNPTKYSRELDAAYRKYPGQCIYHLSQTHLTPACFIKKECEKTLADNVSGTTPTALSLLGAARLRHMTEDVFEDASPDELIVDFDDSSSNDTNDAILAYFARMSNHYLRLASASSGSFGPSRHSMKYPIIADSGASCHMFKEKEFFSYITPSSGSILLGDVKTTLQIEGLGTVQCYIDNNYVTILNVRYVPSLGESVYSLLTHMKQKDHGLQSSSDQGLFLIFPAFKTKAIIGAHDIYLNAFP